MTFAVMLHLRRCYRYLGYDRHSRLYPLLFSSSAPSQVRSVSSFLASGFCCHPRQLGYPLLDVHSLALPIANEGKDRLTPEGVLSSFVPTPC